MKQLFEITKWIGSIAGVTAIIAGLAVSNYKAQQDREALKVGQAQQRELTDSLLIEMRSIKIDVTHIKTAQIEQGEQQTMIKNYVIKHFSMDKSITKDDMLQLFRDFEKKKYGSSLFSTVQK